MGQLISDTAKLKTEGFLVTKPLLYLKLGINCLFNQFVTNKTTYPPQQATHQHLSMCLVQQIVN